MIKKMFLISVFVVLWGSSAIGQEPTVRDILDKVKASFRAMDTYQVEGTVYLDVTQGGRDISRAVRFLSCIKKPNFYRLTWTLEDTVTPGMQQFAVWNDGNGPHVLFQDRKIFARMDSDTDALVLAEIFSGGVFLPVTVYFLPEFGPKDDFLVQLKNPVLEQSEPVNGEECYVVSGSTGTSKKETYWISHSGYQILKWERALGLPEQGAELPDLTDAQLSVLLKLNGEDVNEESLKRVRESLAQLFKMQEDGPVKMTGRQVWTAEKTSSPDLSAQDCQVDVPEGVVLVEDLFAELNKLKSPHARP